MEIEEKIIPRVIEEEMKTSYLDYSMSVIVGRALPDVKDGLKPVHRRILYAMHKMGMFHNKPFKKCARIVGEVLGKYHPHGDSSVYDALVRMVQSFSLRYPLVRGQGNFGSIDGDRAAAMRYTEAKLSKLAEEMLQDIEKNTVKFSPNFDASLKEPVYLPAKLPNLLINGSSGIAVGMATNIPPHNLNEIADAAIQLIENPEIEINELMQSVQGPDFPTGGIITGKTGIRNAFTTGRGRVQVKAKAKIEETKNGMKIIVTEIPYMVNKSLLLTEIAHLVRDKKIKGITDLRDESDREGMRIVITIKKEANSDIILNQLYKHSRLKVTFGIITLCLVDNEPKVLNLKQLLEYYVKHRQDIVRKRTEYSLSEASKRAHILEGLIIALDDLDNTIKLIKASESASEAKKELIERLKLSDEQAQAILDMKLQRLTGLEQEKIRTEHKGLLELISKLQEILDDENKILKIIKDELIELKEKYGNPRRTQIIAGEDIELTAEELIQPEDMIITLTHTGYIKRLKIDTYKQQKRGGKGVLAAGTKEEDFVEDLFIANTHSYVLLFTSKGKVKWVKVYDIPEASRQSRGTSVKNLLSLEAEERITAFIPVKEFKKGYLFMVTKKGIVKKTPIEEFSRPRKGGIIAIGLKDDDDLMGVKLTDGNRDMMIATEKGMAVKFNEKDVRAMGRTAGGVRGIRLKQDDKTIGMIIAKEGEKILTITEKGYGKKTPIEDYRLVGRGSVGVKNLHITEKTGKVVAVKSVNGDELMLISQNGIGIRVSAKEVSEMGRATQGVRVMRLKDGDKVGAVAKIVQD